MSYNYDDRPNRKLTWFLTQWWVWALFLLLIVVVTVFVFGWIATPLQIFSQGNVREQWRAGYDGYESLKATAQQVCTAEKAVAAATTDTERTQRMTQQIAYENNYARIAAEYDARMRNNFEAGLVRPNDLPARAPTLVDMKLNLCGG